MSTYKLFVNNEWVDSSDGKTFTSYDPSNGKEVSKFSSATAEDINRICDLSREVFESGVWSDMDPDDRADLMLKAAEIMKRRKRELAEYEAKETGRNKVCF